MTTIARRFAARPVRTSIEAWAAVRDALCQDNNPAVDEFDRIQGVAASVISSNLPAAHPFVFIGEGPRVRVFMVYDNQALEGEDLNESPLVSSPFRSSWTGWVPALPDEIELVQTHLRRMSDCFVAYNVNHDLPEPQASRQDRSLTLDREAMRRL